MTELFASNLEIIQFRWPAAAELLRQQQAEHLDAALVTGQNQTISINGIQLSSRHDRQAEAKLYIDALDDDARNISLYGVGMGDIPILLVNCPDVDTVQVNVMNPAVFALLISYTNQSSWLGHPKLTLTLTPDQHKIAQNHIALPADLELCSDANARLRDLLIMKQNIAYANTLHHTDDPATAQRLQDNRTFLHKDPDIRDWTEASNSQEAIVIGSGPSLEEHYEALGKLMGKTERPLIICADTALRGLIHHDIRPDIVMSIDERIGTYHLPLEDCDGIVLVYFPRLNPEVIANWPGPRFNAYGSGTLYDQLATEIPKTRLYTNGSVIHPAIDVAIQSGCRDITLLGCDFCYCNDKSHAFWADYGKTSHDRMTQNWVRGNGRKAKIARHWVLDGHGQKVPTDLNLRAYLRTLESYIAQQPEVAFYQSSRSGAKIHGCHYREFS